MGRERSELARHRKGRKTGRGRREGRGGIREAGWERGVGGRVVRSSLLDTQTGISRNTGEPINVKVIFASGKEP